MPSGGSVLIAINKISCELLIFSIGVKIKQIFKKMTTVNNIKIILYYIYIPLDASSDMYSNQCAAIEST